nr:MAG TPA: hypothetical protein [Caudoviricetes sp.]
MLGEVGSNGCFERRAFALIVSERSQGSLLSF